MDSVEDYARQWVKREKEDLDTLSEWLKSVWTRLYKIELKNSVTKSPLLNKNIGKLLFENLQTKLA